MILEVKVQKSEEEEKVKFVGVKLSCKSATGLHTLDASNYCLY